MGRVKLAVLALVSAFAITIPGMAFARPSAPPQRYNMPHRQVQMSRPSHHHIHNLAPTIPRHMWGGYPYYGGYYGYGYRYPTLHGRDYGNMILYAVVSGAANAYANRVINSYPQQQVIYVPVTTTTTTTETVIIERVK